jgi:hypothetical protein
MRRAGRRGELYESRRSDDLIEPDSMMEQLRALAIAGSTMLHGLHQTVISL